MENKTNKKFLVWMDLEMTGLDIEKEKILEIAVIITDENLNIEAELDTIVIHQDDSVLESMDEWNKTTHTKTGLLKKVRASSITERVAEMMILDFLKKYVQVKSSPLCGNSIYNDRKFISKYMKELDNFLHYRLIDVSSVKELALRWYDIKFEKQNTHQALDDIRESIKELKFYKEKMFCFPR